MRLEIRENTAKNVVQSVQGNCLESIGNSDRVKFEYQPLNIQMSLIQTNELGLYDGFNDDYNRRDSKFENE